MEAVNMKFERGIGVTTKELSKYFITLEGNDGSGKVAKLTV